MQGTHARFRRALELFALALLVSTFIPSLTSAQQQPNVTGVWQAHVAGLPIILRLNADGTGDFDDEAFKYTVRGASIVVEDSDGVTTYNYTLRGDSLVVSGGDLPGALTFTRLGADEAAKREARRDEGPARTSDSERPRASNPLVGRWQSEQGTAVISDDGTLTLDGARYGYSVRDNVITITRAGDSSSFPFELSGDTLKVQADGQTVVYRRVGGAGDEGAAGAAEELVGKWCYMANVNTGSGGRMSNRCFTLNADGTYEYYSETSSSAPVASSASQESDAGRWTATATTITAQSPKTGTNTYRLERRNHPKTGDPMLVIDGDAYVTATQRPPWPE